MKQKINKDDRSGHRIEPDRVGKMSKRPSIRVVDGLDVYRTLKGCSRVVQELSLQNVFF